MIWIFHGAPYYLEKQARRLGMSQTVAHRARHNPEIYHVSVLLAQICERYHRTRREGGRPVFLKGDMEQIRATLQQAEQEAAKLHALAAASEAMLDEAWQAFELSAPDRGFRVVCHYDRTVPDCTAGGPAERTQ